MPQSRGLGRGLGALLPDLDSVKDVDVRLIPMEKIKSSPYQPRKSYSDEDIEELAASIKQHGILQPIIVRPIEGMFEIVAGERRWRAAQKAKLEEIPAVVRELDPRSIVGIALVENIQREELNPLEEAEAFRKLIDEFHLSHEEIAGVVGKSRSYVTNMLRLLRLPEEVRELLLRRDISMGHAKALLSVGNKDKLLSVARMVVRKGLSVRETEDLVKRLLSSKTKTKKTSWKRSKEEKDLESELKGILNMDIKVYRGYRGFKVEFIFSDDENMAEFISLIKKSLARADR